MKNKTKILLLRATPVNPDPRVERTVLMLEDDFDITILSWDRNCNLPKKDRLHHAKIIRFQGIKIKALKKVNFLLWHLFVVQYILFHRFKVVHACDFDTYFPAFFPAKLTGKKIIYDIFDNYVDMLFIHPAIKKIVGKLDVFLTKRANMVLLPDENRLQVVGKLNKNIRIIYNSPPDILQTLQKTYPQEPDKNKITICYLGLLDNRQRDLMPFIDIISKSDRLEFYLAGRGKDEKTIENAAKQYDNIRFFGNVSYSEALKLEYMSDAILAVYDPAIQNNILASPNKLFEAMMLGKPTIINEEVQAASLIQKFDIGYTYAFGNYKSLSRLFAMIENNPEALKIKGENSRKLYDEKYSFAINKEVLQQIYQHL